MPDTVFPIRYVAKNMRLDLRLIAEMISPGARVLDIGCGDGALLGASDGRARAADARGIEIDMAEVTRAVAAGLAVIHGDADHDLGLPIRTTPSITWCCRAPCRRWSGRGRCCARCCASARRAIVSFPNFGHWLVRWQVLATGKMPMTDTWHRAWYETPNIHPCTIRDFFDLCALEGYVVEQWLAVDERGLKAPWKRSARLANLFGEQALFLLRRG